MKADRFSAQIYFFAALVMALSIGFSASVAAQVENSQQTDSKKMWNKQFSINLPERSRSIRLNGSMDATQWVVDNNLQDANILSLGRQGSVVDVPMDEVEWQNAQESLCRQNGVELCEVTLCRSIQFGGSVHSTSNSNAVKTRIVRNDPERVADNASETSTCKAPLAVVLDNTAAAQNVNVDVTQIQEATDNTAVDQSTAQESTVHESTEEIASESSLNGETDLTQAETDSPVAESEISSEATAPEKNSNRAFEYVLDSTLGLGGELLVDASDLPEDTTEWTLVVGEGCNEVRVPLDSLEPARVPGRVVAITDAGVAAQVAATVGATLLTEVNLITTEQSLATFASDDALQLIAALLLDPRVSFAQRDFIYRTTQGESDSSLPDSVLALEQQAEQHFAEAASTIPVYEDTFADLTYGPKFTRALDLHVRAKGEGQIVAVIDTGIDIEHPELLGRIEGEPINTTEFGWSADAHGTAIAGIVAANANNSEGIYGVAPGAKILAIKACQPRNEGGMDARCYTSTLVKALDEAINQNATLINMSISGPPDELVEQYVQLALEQHRVVIAAAGNGGPDAKPGFPAAIPGVVAVTAIDANQRLYKQATRGDYIDVAAPGVDIISPVPGGNYPALSGTSMAAAQVTGVAALLKELNPELDGLQIAQWLSTSTRELGQREQFGRGLLDACAAAQHIAADVCFSMDTSVDDLSDDVMATELEFNHE